jgi:hypothetical protein
MLIKYTNEFSILGTAIVVSNMFIAIDNIEANIKGRMLII